MADSKLYLNKYSDGTQRYSFDSRDPNATSSEYLRQLGADNTTNLMSAQLTNDNNLQLAKLQNDWNIQQWNRENEYNDPSAQLDRYVKAGINPLSANITGNQANQLQSVAMNNQTPGQIDPNSDTNRMNAISSSAQNVLSSVKTYLENQVQIKQLALQDRQLDIAERNANTQAYSAKSTAKLQSKQGKYIGSQTKGQDIVNSHLNERISTEINKINAEIDLIGKNGDFTEQQTANLKESFKNIANLDRAKISHLYASISNLNADTIGKHKDNALKDFEINLSKFGISPKADWVTNLFMFCARDPKTAIPRVKEFLGGLKEGFEETFGKTPSTWREVEDLVNDRINELFGDEKSHYNPNSGQGSW